MSNALVVKKKIHDGDEPYVTATVEMTLGEIIDMDIEELNDYVEHCIMDPGDDWVMSYIRYDVEGVRDDGVLLIRVTADLVEM